jgi:hypothetical protein
MCRVEMLDEHERHSRVDRHLREELRQRFEPPCRGAHADDGTRVHWADGGRPRLRRCSVLRHHALRATLPRRPVEPPRGRPLRWAVLDDQSPAAATAPTGTLGIGSGRSWSWSQLE